MLTFFVDNDLLHRNNWSQLDIIKYLMNIELIRVIRLDILPIQVLIHLIFLKA